MPKIKVLNLKQNGFTMDILFGMQILITITTSLFVKMREKYGQVNNHKKLVGERINHQYKYGRWNSTIGGGVRISVQGEHRFISIDLLFKPTTIMSKLLISYSSKSKNGCAISITYHFKILYVVFT